LAGISAATVAVTVRAAAVTDVPATAVMLYDNLPPGTYLVDTKQYATQRTPSGSDPVRPNSIRDSRATAKIHTSVSWFG